MSLWPTPLFPSVQGQYTVLGRAEVRLPSFTKGKPVNKTQLVDALSSRYEGNRKQAQHALESVLDVITREVVRGEKVAITGFGSFEKRVREARWVRNPRTGDRIKAKKTAIPKFTAGADLKALVSGAKKLPKLPSASQVAKQAADAAKKSAPAKKAASVAKKAGSAGGARKATAKKAPAKKSAPAKKTTAKKTTAKKAPTKKTTAAKKAPAKKTTTKKAPTKKTTAAKKAPAKKTTAKKAPAKKSTAKKAPAKKS